MFTDITGHEEHRDIPEQFWQYWMQKVVNDPTDTWPKLTLRATGNGDWLDFNPETLNFE